MRSLLGLLAACFVDTTPSLDGSTVTSDLESDSDTTCACPELHVDPDGVVVAPAVCLTDGPIVDATFDEYLASLKAREFNADIGWSTSQCLGALDNQPYDLASVSTLVTAPDSGYNEEAVFDGSGTAVWSATWDWYGGCDWADEGPGLCCNNTCCGGVEPTCVTGHGTFTPLTECVVIERG